MRKIASIFSPFFYINLVVNLKFKWRGLRLKTFESNEFIVKYWDKECDKPALVLIQAFAAKAKFSWHNQLKALNKDYRLIVPNLIYFGGSSMKGDNSYLIKDQVKAIDQLITHLNLDEVMLCGASYGGVIATEYTVLRPEKVTKLVLTNSPLKYDSNEDLQLVLDDFGLKTKTDLLVPANYMQLYKLFSISYYKRPPIPKFIFKSIYKNLYADIAEKRNLVDVSSSELDKLRPKKYDINIPILLIWGEHDRICPLHVGKQLKDHFGGVTQLQIIEDTAHMPNFEKPKEYNKILASFLKD